MHYQRDDHITAMHISNKMHGVQRNVGWCNQRALWGPSEPQSKDTMHTMENIAQGNMSEIYHSRHLRWDGAPAGFTNWFVWSALSPQPSLEVVIKTFAGLYQGWALIGSQPQPLHQPSGCKFFENACKFYCARASDIIIELTQFNKRAHSV